MSKALEFKKRAEKNTQVQAQADTNDMTALKQSIGKMFQMIAEYEQRLEQVTATAKVADWRSLGLLKVLSEGMGGDVFEKRIMAKAEEMQVEAFNKESELDDAARKLEAFDGPAENGLYAISRVRLFKLGEEIHNSQVLRTKYELGKNELLPQIDEATLGMVPGETKRFPLALAGQTDEAELYLIGLRKAKLVVVKAPENTETPPSDSPPLVDNSSVDPTNPEPTEVTEPTTDA
jgi:hypothetical protein